MSSLSEADKAALLAEFERPKVVARTPEEVFEMKNIYIQMAENCRLEGAEPDDFAKVVSMEEARGELTEEQALEILMELHPEETARIEAKVARLKELGLSWCDL